MPAPATHDFVHLEISSASVLNISVTGPLNYLIGRDTGSDDSIEIEDSLEILSGSGGRYLRLPQGTTGQRPTGAAGLLRLNTTLGSLDYHDGVGWEQPLTPEAITFAALNANGDVGSQADQLAEGGHNHQLMGFGARDGVTPPNFTVSSSFARFQPFAVDFQDIDAGIYIFSLSIYATTDPSGGIELRIVDRNDSDNVLGALSNYVTAPYFDHIEINIPTNARLQVQNRRAGAIDVTIGRIHAVGIIYRQSTII